jgi:hypothetical protein
MPSWDWKWFLTFCLAAWGAGLSTYQAIQKWRENRANVKVTLNFNTMLLPAGGPPVPALRVGVENHGFRDVTFNPSCIELEIKGTDKRLLLTRPDYCDVTFPHTLKHGTGFSVLMAMKDLVSGNVPNYADTAVHGACCRL